MSACDTMAIEYSNPLMEKPVHDERGSVETSLYIPRLNHLPRLHFEKNTTEHKKVKIDWSTALPPIQGTSRSIHRPL